MVRGKSFPGPGIIFSGYKRLGYRDYLFWGTGIIGSGLFLGISIVFFGVQGTRYSSLLFIPKKHKETKKLKVRFFMFFCKAKGKKKSSFFSFLLGFLFCVNLFSLSFSKLALLVVSLLNYSTKFKVKRAFKTK